MDTLRRLPGKPKTRQFATIDIEARHWVEPYAVGFYDGSSYVDFVDHTFTWKAIDDALTFVLQPKYAGWWIYAHNGGNYDFSFFLRSLMFGDAFRRRYFVEVTPIGSCIVRFDVVERCEGIHKAACVDPQCRGCDGSQPKGQKRMKWSFIDSARLMPLPLNEVGEAFGIGKKVDTGISYDDLALPANQEPMKHYLRVDCELLHRAIVKMQDIVNDLGGQIGVTLPSTALDLFRRRFMKDDIAPSRHSLSCPQYDKKRPKNRPKDALPEAGECRGCLHALIRESYCGGRTEIFRMQFPKGGYVDESRRQVSTGDAFDFSGHYPACMLEPMPTGEAVELSGLDESAILSNARGMVGFVECDVFIPTSCYLPPLPMKTKEGKLIFPVGHLTGTWNTAELQLLSRVGGRIIRSRRSLWYATSNVFARFIRALYKFRDKKAPDWNKGLDWIAKILMNSLYGKFAMVEERSRIVIHPDSPVGLKPLSLDADVWVEECYVSPGYVVPQLSAHVTALARARLWERLTDVLDQGGRIYYTDTDSEHISGAKVKSGEGLGELKFEGSFTRAEYTLPKLYLVEWVEAPKSKKSKERELSVKAKGMGPGIRIGDGGKTDDYGGQLSEADFVDLVRNGLPIERHRLSKLREGLRDYAREKVQFPRVVANPKLIKATYDKRKVLADCNTVPLEVKCW